MAINTQVGANFRFVPHVSIQFKTPIRHLLNLLAIVVLFSSSASIEARADLTPLAEQKEENTKISACTSVGSIWWNELLSPTTEGLGDFYSKVVGWNKKNVDAKDQTSPAKTQIDQYTIFTSGKKEIAGIMKSSHAEAIQPNMVGWFVYIQVADVERAVEQAEKEGGTILQEPIEITGQHKVAVIMDPSGNIFGVVRPANC